MVSRSPVAADGAHVTCVVPVFNGERFLREALESVLEQDRPPDEIVVVDDGSTDGTMDVLSAFEDSVVVVRQTHAGVAAARNRGLAEVRGDFVAFQDSDDLWTPGGLRLLITTMLADSSIELCFGQTQNFWMEELAEEEAGYRESRFVEPIQGHSLASLLARMPVFEKVGPFNEELRVGSDTEWFLRAREAGVVEGKVAAVVVRRRLHEGNLTRPDLAGRDQLLETMKASLDRRRAQGDG